MLYDKIDDLMKIIVLVFYLDGTTVDSEICHVKKSFET
jgi:hypothetical protein